MSELYRTSGETAPETQTESGAAADTGASAGEWPEIDENTEEDIVLEERLAEEEEKFGGTTREGEAEATWGSDADDGEYDDQAGEYDQGWDTAPTADDGELPRQEEAEATWGPDANPDIDDESMSAGYDGDLDGALAASDMGSGELSQQEETAATWGDTTTPDPETEASSPAITHYHADYKGGTLDLYTDGTRWAAWDDSMPRAPDLVAPSGEAPERTPTGEELVEAESGKASMLDRLRRETYRESEDTTDTLQDDANLGHDVFARQPTSSYEGIPQDHPSYVPTAQPGVDAGTLATALFVVGLGAERGVNWAMEHYKHHTRGDDHGGDRRARRGAARRAD